jgi:hypothetical protein
LDAKTTGYASKKISNRGGVVSMNRNAAFLLRMLECGMRIERRILKSREAFLKSEIRIPQSAHPHSAIWRVGQPLVKVMSGV